MTTTPDQAEPPRITFEIVSLFPEMFDGLLATTVIGKAIAAGTVAVHRTNPRDFGLGNYRQVDDTPYGGGPGMIMRVEPIAAALDAIAAARGPSHRILLTPRGRRFDQAGARALAARPRVTLVCGRYEGLDERVASLVDDQICLGDFVLAGGELAAAVVLEATARLVPGVLGCGLSAGDESFSAGRLEYPQWTRPADWNGQGVPPVLLSGDHKAIERWRRAASLRLTRALRPDLLEAHPLTDEEQALLASRRGRFPIPDLTRDPGPSRYTDFPMGQHPLLKEIESSYRRTDLPDLRAGDSVRVHTLIKEGDKERVQIFEGVVIGQHRGGSRASFTVRKVSYGVGVERIFPLHTSRIEKIEVVSRGEVRRARLNYLRELEGKAARIKGEKSSDDTAEQGGGAAAAAAAAAVAPDAATDAAS